MTPLPHNLEAEQALLGALLFDNKTAELITAELRGEHFYDPVHGRIFDFITTAIRAGMLADETTLRDRIVNDPGVKELGGLVYLMKLMEAAAPLSAQSRAYADLVLDLSHRRDIFRLCQTTAKAAMAHEEGTEDIVSAAEAGLRAISLNTRSWKSLRQAGAEIVADLREPAPRAIRSGLVKMDSLLSGGFFAPDLVILAGRPAMGKTALADVLATNVADAGKVVGFFSMEMDPAQIAARVLSRRSSAIGKGFSYSALRQPVHRPDADYVEEMLLPRLPETLLIDPSGAQSVSGIDAQARAMRRQMGRIDFILVDYLQLMREGGGRKGNRTEEVSEITAGLKGLAKRHSVPVVALSQLSRNVENRTDKTPQLADLRESGSIEQDADIVLFVFREHYYLERSQPLPNEGEAHSDFLLRLTKHQRRMDETRHEFKIITGKNRHGAGGQERLYCDLAMDVIADDPPEQHPQHQRWMQDGAS